MRRFPGFQVRKFSTGIVQNLDVLLQPGGEVVCLAPPDLA
jgi:hypothetical protein